MIPDQSPFSFFMSQLHHLRVDNGSIKLLNCHYNAPHWQTVEYNVATHAEMQQQISHHVHSMFCNSVFLWLEIFRLFVLSCCLQWMKRSMLNHIKNSFSFCLFTDHFLRSFSHDFTSPVPHNYLLHFASIVAGRSMKLIFSKYFHPKSFHFHVLFNEGRIHRKLGLLAFVTAGRAGLLFNLSRIASHGDEQWEETILTNFM